MNALTKLRVGDTVIERLSGAGLVTEERFRIARIDTRGIWIANGLDDPDPSGPFDPATGKQRGGTMAGFAKTIRSIK